MDIAPIVLFVYNRPFHTRRTVEALQLNNLAKDSDLIIFSDAPKDDKSCSAVKDVRCFIKTIGGFKNITIIEREENFGLVRSIKEGVTDIVNRFGKIIVLEDDLVTHPQFLEFSNDALEFYKKNKEVFAITGYSFLKSSKNDDVINKTYFLELPSTWGWSTWSDRWAYYDKKSSDFNVLDRDKILKKRFNYDNTYNYYKMLHDRNNGHVKSWGIMWYWCIFREKGLTLFPSDSLISQIGQDGSGENYKNYRVSEDKIKNLKYYFNFPELIKERLSDRKKMVKILKYRKLVILYSIIAEKINSIFLKE
ncbi:sugar transferase [Flavobacterium sp. XS2P39]|uniref:sugar transferase n=1 Tax=Flavobacterium sp. XS2P39 TaxID=3401725 RepID=UPI003AAF2CBB